MYSSFRSHSKEMKCLWFNTFLQLIFFHRKEKLGTNPRTVLYSYMYNKEYAIHRKHSPQK
jgi:hypothetical protein